LIARHGVRASHVAKRRVAMMKAGSAFDSNRPASHWKRVHCIARQLLPYDGDDELTHYPNQTSPLGLPGNCDDHSLLARTR
jgi:hypothetical protein